ncbi:MAG: DNA mismatch repair endonuclease MutL [Flavobacteriaceae bacterium]|nr:DNA mismatch repair endonuclease MutL [Cryomorphaceae bacterium]MBL6677452.1 DNA mismatch repair endonuclease MutL [Flavobacteriaceae bacterium]
MLDIIKILPSEVSNKIAAGEVVQRPSSALKELIENSIDANSTKIQIIIKDAGKNLIQVIDNGKGMSKNDMHLSFIKHATSKINKIEDIYSISSMGFRGEALAAIASVSMLEMESITDNQNGHFIEINGGKLLREKVSNIQEGTSIKIKNLFYNIPARRNFLKSNFVELRHILDVFHRLAISHPEIEFSFINNDEEIFYLKGESLKKRIVSIFGEKVRENLIPINESTQIADISGFVLKPEFSKKSRSNQFVFVNKRFIKSQFINHSIFASYNGLLKDGYYPGYFLFIDIDPTKIDINVHPNKTEIKFDDDQNLYSIINSSVKHCLGIYQVSPILDFDKDPSMDISYDQVKSQPRIPAIEINSEFNPFEVFNDEKVNNVSYNYLAPNSKLNFEDDNNQKLKIFQILNKFIVSTNKSSLIIINQNLAHQRILYESFLKSIFENSANSQKLVFPIELSLTKKQLLLYNKIIDEFKSIGFDIIVRNELMLIESIPFGIEKNKVEEVIENILNEEFNTSNDFSASDFFAKRLSKITSIKTGQKLNLYEQEYIVNNLFSCKEPNLSPDNKQIFITLNKNDIEKKFNG